MQTSRSLEGAALFPRVYRASRGWLISMTLCGVLLAVGGMVGTWFAATAVPKPPQSRVWLIGLGLGFGCLGIYCLLSTFWFKIVLFPDRIEIEELTQTAVLSRQDIRGWRWLPTSPPGLVFVHRDTSRRRLKVTQVFRLDPEFSEWLYTLPNLDTEDTRASKIEIRNNARLGATPGQRMKALAKGRRLATALTAVASLASLWRFVYPRPYEVTIAILAALPWIAVETVRRSRGLFRMDKSRNDAYPNVVIPYIFPATALMLRSVFEYNIIPSSTVVWFSVGIGGLLCLAAFAADATMRSNVISATALAAFSLAYGYGVAIEANALLDRSSGTSYTANVEEKRIVRGKATTYELELGPWGPIAKRNKLEVAPATFDPIQPGDVVCLTLKRGALGVNWFFMRAWQRRD